MTAFECFVIAGLFSISKGVNPPILEMATRKGQVPDGKITIKLGGLIALFFFALGVWKLLAE